MPCIAVSDDSETMKQELKAYLMQKPYRFTVICNKTGNVLQETNCAPLLHHLKTWEPTDDPTVFVELVTKTVYEDMRYEAKLRLWNYITFTKNGLEIPKYRPFAGTEIGKTLPILNF